MMMIIKSAWYPRIIYSRQHEILSGDNQDNHHVSHSSLSLFYDHMLCDTRCLRLEVILRCISCRWRLLEITYSFAFCFSRSAYLASYFSLTAARLSLLHLGVLEIECRDDGFDGPGLAKYKWLLGRTAARLADIECRDLRLRRAVDVPRHSSQACGNSVLISISVYRLFEMSMTALHEERRTRRAIESTAKLFFSR